jgi:hypothetical protein
MKNVWLNSQEGFSGRILRKYSFSCTGWCGECSIIGVDVDEERRGEMS